VLLEIEKIVPIEMPEMVNEEDVEV